MKKESKTKIIATIGPVSGDLKTLREMIKNKMNVARLNMSHGTYEEHEKYIKNIRNAAKLEKKEIPIILDLSGPRIQKGKEHSLNKKIKNIITEKDKRDVLFGIKNKINFFALSFVKNQNDIKELKKILLKNKSTAKIIAKIERKEALKNLENIIKVSDAIMIARGDLGEALPYEDLPYIQNKIIKECIKHKRSVIVATEMLFSMKEALRPTRAEVSDIAFAILEHADSVMLSDETAMGKHPTKTVETMEKIIIEAEKMSKKLKKPLNVIL